MPSIWPDNKFQLFTNFSSDEDFADILSQLSAFETNAHFYCFLAGLAFSEKKKPITTKKTSNKGEIRGAVFKNLGLEGQIFAIALSEKGDYSVLKDDDDCYKIFEGYVNAGFQILQKKSEKFSSANEFVDELLEDIRKKAQKNKKHEDVVVDPGDSPNL